MLVVGRDSRGVGALSSGNQACGVHVPGGGPSWSRNRVAVAENGGRQVVQPASHTGHTGQPRCCRVGLARVTAQNDAADVAKPARAFCARHVITGGWAPRQAQFWLHPMSWTPITGPFSRRRPFGTMPLDSLRAEAGKVFGILGGRQRFSPWRRSTTARFVHVAVMVHLVL